MTKLLAALAALALFGVLLYFSFGAAPAPPEVSFAAVSRRPLVSTIVTNGKVEPAGYVAVRAPREGSILRLAVEKGQPVKAGQVLAEIDAPGLVADLRSAEARISAAKSELAVIERGGSSLAPLTDIDNAISAARLELEAARREREKTARLVEKHAETQEALTAATDRVRQLEARIEALGRSRSAQQPPPGAAKEAASARLREAEAAKAAVEQRIAQSLIRAPSAGIVFNREVKPGAFVHPGDLIAEIGRSGTVSAIVYVDEPELGRVAKGMPVKITWDALPDRVWDAEVDRMPTQIVPLNSRQVGEVICTVANQDGALPPGANINAEIVSREVPNALAIPKAALRREGMTVGVLVLKRPENKLEWRPVQVGISSITYAAIDGGLREGELVALPGETAFEAGQIVAPKLP